VVTEEYCIPGLDVVHCDRNVPTFGINLLPLSPDEGKKFIRTFGRFLPYCMTSCP